MRGRPRHPSPGSRQGEGLTKEVAVRSVIQDPQQRNPQSQPRGDRFERADFFEQHREFHTQGISERQAAQELQGPRTTLHAWRIWYDTLDSCPHVAACFPRRPGRAFFHRIVIAFHLVCVDVGACGMRLVCLLLNLPGRDRVGAAAYGAQQQVHLPVAPAIVTSRHDATARVAQDMPQQDLTVPQDETFTGGLCLVTMDPESHFILLEQLAQARNQASWHALMAPALAQLNCRVIQSTSDEAPGLLAYVEHYLEVHHSPDLFQVQHELVKAVSGPMATKERAAHKAVTEAREQLEWLQIEPQNPGDEPDKRRPGHCPQQPVSLEHAEQALEAASREHERLAQQRAQVKASLRRISHDYHLVDLERGVRRNGRLIAAAIQGHIEQMRTIAQQEGLSQSCLERIEKAERVVPNMQATSAFVSRYVGQQVAQLEVTPPASFAMHAKLIPS